MDTKNVIAAISLSAAVIVLYALFFPPSPTQKSQDLSELSTIKSNPYFIDFLTMFLVL